MTANQLRRRAILTLPLAGLAESASGAPIFQNRDARSTVMAARAGVTREPQLVRRLKLDAYVNAVAWNSEGSRLAALSNFGGTVTIWDSGNWQVVKEFHRYGGAYSENSFAFLPDGTLLTAAPIGNTSDPNFQTSGVSALIQWNAEAGQPVRYIPEAGRLLGVSPQEIGKADTFAVSADGSLVAGITKGRNVVLFETRGWSIVNRWVTPPTPRHPDSAWSVAVSPDNQFVVVGTIAGFVHMFEVRSGARVFSFSAFAGSGTVGFFGCESVQISRANQTLATGRGGVSIGQIDDGWVRLWRPNDQTPLARLKGGEGSVRSLGWNFDGTMLAAADDKSLRLWRIAEAGRDPEFIMKKPIIGFSLAFSPGGDLAASDATDVVIYR